MYQQKIGMSLEKQYSISKVEVVKMLKRIGFEAISLAWEEDVQFAQLIEQAKECELIIQSLHAPQWKVADMWSFDANCYEPVKQELLRTLEDCKKFGIPVMVVHAWFGFDYEFDVSNLNFTNFDELVARAEEYGVKIAFENAEGPEYLSALMERYENNHMVGFCWDLGHEICYNAPDFLAKYGDRLIMTHLNDNLGVRSYDGTLSGDDDLHLLPYDGVADWDYNIERLQKSKPVEILNFELKIKSKKNRHENDLYSQMGLELYFTEAYKRACRIAYRYSRTKM